MAADGPLLDAEGEIARRRSLQADMLKTALEGAREEALRAVQRLVTVQAAVCDFVEEIGLSPDKGDYDAPPEDLAPLMTAWTDVSTTIEIRRQAHHI